VVFFTDSEKLTEDASIIGSDLYRCEIGLVGEELGCITLSNITGPAAAPGESAEVRGIASGLSADGTKIYFVANGVLDAQPNAFDEVAQAGQPNMYLWQEGEGLRFIAPLSNGDATDWGEALSAPGARSGKLSAAISPSGRYLAFMSLRSLTGYDSRNPFSDSPNEEAFLYDAVEDELLCLSCSPTGTAANGEMRPFIGVEGGQAPPVDIEELWSNKQVAATLPIGSLRNELGPSLYQPRAVFDSGRVFFNAFDGLVPADSNENWDAYQFEPLKVGDCVAAPASSAVARVGDGCVGLISSGKAEGESAFVDASASGDDVFIMTRGRLSALDKDNAMDLYDARVDGIATVSKLVPECSGEDCREAPFAPSAVPPGSAGFDGPGNVKSSKKCPKGTHKIRRQGKVKCAPKRQKQKKRSQRENSNRGVER
jgi:hypothetical protein